MRERLVAAFVGLTVLVIALYGIPHAYHLARFAEAQERREIAHAVDIIAVLVSDAGGEGERVTSELLDRAVGSGERLAYQPPDGPTIVAGDLTGESGDDISTTRELADGGTVTLSRSGAMLTDRVSEALLPLALIGLALVAASAAAGFWLATALARPFQSLASAAQELGTGRFDLDIPHYRVPEAEAIGTALRDSARQLDALARKDRESGLNASHLLRTPITALRLDLEDLSLWPQTPPEVAAQLSRSLSELDRLSTAVTGLVESSRVQVLSTAIDLDLAALVDDTVRRRQPRARGSGQELAHRSDGAVPAWLPAQPVVEILEALLAHLDERATGPVAVETADRGTHLVVLIAAHGRREDAGDGSPADDDGPGPDDRAVDLEAVKDLATSLGGHLVVDPTPHTGFAVMLPKRSQSGNEPIP